MAGVYAILAALVSGGLTGLILAWANSRKINAETDNLRSRTQQQIFEYYENLISTEVERRQALEREQVMNLQQIVDLTIELRSLKHRVEELESKVVELEVEREDLVDRNERLEKMLIKERYGNENL